MTFEKIKDIVANSMNQIKDPHLKASLGLAVVEPKSKVVEHFDSTSRNSMACEVWIVFDVQERDVVLLYSCEGYFSEGYPWGISFRDSKNFGPPSFWYKSLEECALDSGYFD